MCFFEKVRRIIENINYDWVILINLIIQSIYFIINQKGANSMNLDRYFNAKPRGMEKMEI